MTSQTRTQNNAKVAFFVVLLLLAVVWVGIFYYVDPAEFVQTIGVRNGYIFVFLIALFGGVSSLTFSTYIGTLLLLSSGGLNPYLLGLASGLGVAIGDSVYFYLGRHGRALLKGGSITQLVTRLTRWLDSKRPWVASVITYLYVSFTPLPNDLIAIAMGLSGRRYIPIIIPLVLGNMTHTILIALFGTTLSLLW